MSPKKYNLLLTAVFSVSWAAVLIRLCDAPALVIAFYRMGIAAVLLLPIVLLRYTDELKALLSSSWKLTLLSGVFLGLHFALWVSSLFYTSVASSVVIVATQPLFALTFSWIFLKEKAQWLTLLAILLALAGVYVIAAGDFQLDSRHLIGDLLSLLGAMMAAAYLTVGRNLRQKFHIAPYVFVVYLVSAVTLGLMVVLFGHSFAPLSGENLFYFLLLAIVPTLIGHSLYNYLLKYITAYTVGISILGEPLGASLWAFLIFAEAPAEPVYWGGVLILAGVLMALWSERKKRII
jgi:drug/metabolite transporter (DMT)-like permease